MGKLRWVWRKFWVRNHNLLYCPAVFGHFSPASVQTNPINQSSQSWLIVNQSINQRKSTMEVYAWLIDLIRRRKNWPTGMISGWVQKVTEHHGTIQFLSAPFFHVFLQSKKKDFPLLWLFPVRLVDLRRKCSFLANWGGGVLQCR